MMRPTSTRLNKTSNDYDERAWEKLLSIWVYLDGRIQQGAFLYSTRLRHPFEKHFARFRQFLKPQLSQIGNHHHNQHPPWPESQGTLPCPSNTTSPTHLDPHPQQNRHHRLQTPPQRRHHESRPMDRHALHHPERRPAPGHHRRRRRRHRAHHALHHLRLGPAHVRRHAARRHHGPRGDRVVVLPVIACGDCAYCARGEYSLCDKTNPSEAMAGMYGHRLAGIFGYSHLTGGYAGDQAEYCRVPNARI